MQQRKLGQSGLLVSIAGLGGNNFGGRMDLEATRRVVHKALDLGITLIDTADAYGTGGSSEQCLGQVLGPRRKDVVLATKFGLAVDADGAKGASRAYIMQAVEASLARLKTDWIDLYQLHRPDPLTPIEETLRALDDLVRQGKVRYIGCSNLPAAELINAHRSARSNGLAGFISCQDQYSLLARDIEHELVPAIMSCGLGLLPYFPLASGLLTGKFERDKPLPADARLAYSRRHSDRFLSERNWRVLEQLTDFCEQRGHTLLELALSWLALQPGVASVIAGASTTEQLEQNVAAMGWQLSSSELAEIAQMTSTPGP